ncbi:hypothetical protein HAX54_009157, partial [Datura stramonium]|nr:hypothetical protein [Datura stramonium]
IVTSSRQQGKEKAPSTSKSKGKGKAKATPTSTNTRDAIILCVPGMKEHHLSCVDKPMTRKKCFNLERLRDDFPNINAQFNKRHWHMFTEPLPNYFPKLVPEFYTSYQTRQDAMKHKGKVDDFPCLPLVMVHRVEVYITPDAINSIFLEDEIDWRTEFAVRVAAKEDQFGSVAGIYVL